MINIQGEIPGSCHGPFDHKKRELAHCGNQHTNKYQYLGTILSFDIPMFDKIRAYEIFWLFELSPYLIYHDLDKMLFDIYHWLEAGIPGTAWEMFPGCKDIVPRPVAGPVEKWKW